ncbi:MAG: InlB B-repeat-containing protein, partial [Clostridiaceae bacterium]
MKGTRFTKFISLLLSVMMVLTLLPSSALAEVTEDPSTKTPVVTNGNAKKEGTSEDPVVKYTVNFYVGKDLVETQEVVEGGFAKRPDNPAVPAADAAEGKTFLYWYAKSESVKFYFDTPIKEDLKLHALFGVVEAPAEAPAEAPSEAPAEAPAAKSSAPGSVLPDSTFLKTYTFMVDEAQYGDTQTVATGDTLFEPAAPTAPAGMRFVGWFDSGNAQFTSFGTQTVEANGDITLHAEFAAAFYAFFYNAGGTAIIETRAPGTDNLVSTTNVTALQIAVDEALIGWSRTPGGSIEGSTVDVSTASVNLFPIIQKVKWISFNSNGGTYVSPMYVAPNTVLTSDLVNAHVDSQVEGTQITKPGYTFNSWIGFPFGSAVTSDITLNATWTTGTANYTIVYLVENSDDTEYSYYSHTVVSAASGSTINSVAHPAITGCTYLSQDLASNNIVKGDGTTVITVKYSRNSYEVKFYKIKYNDWGWEDGYEVDTSKTINAKYGAYIGDQWPLDNGGNRLPYKVSENGSTMQSGLEIMPLNGKSFWAIDQDGNHTYKLYYYVETLNASDPYVATYNGKFYKLHHIDSIKADGLYSTPDDHYDILGFTYTENIAYSNNRANFDSNYEIKFFYNRNIWTLQFYNYNAVDTTHTDTNVKYETDISGRNYTPSLPTGLPTNYVFMGWFTTAACVAGSEYSFSGKTMPNQNVILYAKWA